VTLHVTHKFARVPSGAVAIDTTAGNGLWSELSPFLLPGGELYDGYVSRNMENAWQFAKLYPQHAGREGEPTDAYWCWAKTGWADSRAHRYPMGKGARPLCSFWAGERLMYIDARKRIYAPLYARAVVRTDAYSRLQEMLLTDERDIYLRDWDGYDHIAEGVAIAQVASNPARKMGHAFVLWALLANQYEHLVAATSHDPDPAHLTLII
jgi:hypothetical protein